MRVPRLLIKASNAHRALDAETFEIVRCQSPTWL